MRLPVTNTPWKQKPPEEKWMVVGVFIGFFGGGAVGFLIGKGDRTTSVVSIILGAVLGAVLLRIAYELYRRSGRSA